MREEHQALNFTISSPGWGLYLKKGAERQKEYMAKLLDPAKQREDVMPDDYLRGYIAALLWAAKWPQQEVDEAIERQREQAEQVSAEGTRYDALVEHGYGFGDRLPEEDLGG